MRPAKMARSSSGKGNLAMRIRDELGEVYADARFAAAFGVRGRPGISPGQLMMASVLQFSEDLTDRQAAEAVRDRMTWKYALGLELEDPGFDASVLSEFRSRLVAGDLTCLALDALLERLAGLGLVRGGGRQRTDSTHVLARIRDLNRLELAGETVRAALEALAAAAPGWLAAVRAGRQRAGSTLEGFDVVANVPVVIGPDVAACADAVKGIMSLNAWIASSPASGMARHGT